MSRTSGATAVAVTLPSHRARGRRLSALAAALSVAFVGVGLATSNATAFAAACDRSATPSTLASQVSAATAGQTVCLADGNYGTWGGTNKAITLLAPEGVT